MSIRSPRTLALAVCLAVSAVGGMAHAQTVGFNIRTGDVWVDNRLGEINDYGSRYREPFISELSNNYGAPRSYLTELLTVRRWAPADVYYACSIAHSLGRPCADVVREYDRNPGQGWGVTAQRLGIKPGSKAFHDFKRGTVATYDRWGYPIVLDRNFNVDWSKHGPGHAKGMKHSTTKSSKHGVSPAHSTPSKGKTHAAGDKPHGKASMSDGRGKSGGGKDGGNGKRNGKGK